MPHEHMPRMLYTKIDQSNVCDRCIKEGNNFCPTSDFSEGYCCLPTENCPRAGHCSLDFDTKQQAQYICPNEASCLHLRNIMPPINGDTKTYERLKGSFTRPDICSYKITIPDIADLNDHMFFRLEYTKDCVASLIKGETIDKPVAIYEKVYAGHTFSATKGINFFIKF